MRVGRAIAYGPHPKQLLSLFAPRRRGSESLPLLMFFYGGSWRSGFRDGYEFVGRALAAHGFVVAVPDYRQVPEARFPLFLEDCAEATRWLLENADSHGGDPSGVQLIGHSAGAYNAAMLALDRHWLGPDYERLRAWVGIAGPYAFGRPNAVTKAAFGPDGPAHHAEPVNIARRGSPPALLLHGGRDTVVLPASSERLGRQLRAVGSSATVKVFPQLDHIATIGVFALPFRSRSTLFADVVAFLKEHSA